MQSLDDSFAELQLRLGDSQRLKNTGGDPVFYLVFHPKEMMAAKRKLRSWRAQLENHGWHVEVLSLAQTLNEFFNSHPLRKFWLSGEQLNPADVDSVNATLREALLSNQVVETRILAAVERLAHKQKGILLITDTEALHPYLRIGAVEQRLTGRVSCPVVILYPGRRGGETTLSFLGIYPDDGNYRSTHIGG
ncbi:hypothetical protein F183_A12490 [Bryobacterales bacterium F-183]|nr:hypothetical protein F183_A12490 [Bryobacterales bacterium F-183]